MDRRQKKTRQAVYKAFTSLLERKSFSNITVQDIIDEADIGRSTFYAHFETKEDLLNALCTEIFDHVFAEQLPAEKTHDFSAGIHDLREEITHILYHLRDDRRYIRGILASESGEVFMRYFKTHLARMFDEALTESDPEIPREYMLHHMVCDFAETVRWWMHHDEYTPEQIAGFFLRATPIR